MLKRPITYTDYNGENCVDIVYFNLSKTELISMEVEYEGGLSSKLKKLIESKNDQEAVNFFKEIVLKAYGIKSNDGKRFVKSDELRDVFSQTAAYDSLFIELGTNADAAAAFLKGILPSDLSGEIDKAMEATISDINQVNP